MPDHTRRTFLKQSAAVAAGVPFVPAWLGAGVRGLGALGARRKLVVIQLSGGCDGLNVLAPVGDPRYGALRPNLALRRDEVIRIGAGMGWHPAAAPLARLQDAGALHVLQAVGYPNPHRSHLRSQEVWMTASVDATGANRGWVGRYFDRDRPEAPSYAAMSMGTKVDTALCGQRYTGLAYGNLAGDYAAKVTQDASSSADHVPAALGRARPVGEFPQTAIGRQLRSVAQVMLSDVGTDVFYAEHGGYDTHGRQASKQAKLIGEYATAIGAFVRELRAARIFDDTLVLTCSEFGRRAAENDNAGTDHGKANLAWLIGGAVAPDSAHALVPDLANLDDGGLAMRTDFRSIYATIISRWFGDEHLDLVGDHPLLDFV